MRANNEELIKIAKICMLLAGFWKRPISRSNLCCRIYRAYGIFMQFSFFMLWLLLTMETLRLYIMRYEAIIIILSLSVTVSASKIAAKLMIFRKTNILDLYDDVSDREAEVWTSEDQEIKNSYSKYVLICKSFMLCQLFSTMFTVMTLAIMGVIGDRQLRKYNAANNVSLESHYLYQIWFPANKLDHLGWVYTLNVLFMWCGLLYNSITHMIVVGLFMFLAAQLNVLKIRISKYEKIGRLMENDEKTVILKQFVARHVYLIELVKNLNTKIQYVLLMEFLLSSVDISSVAVNLTKEVSLQTIWHAIYFTLLFLQILIMSWTANEVTLQSVSITDGLYDTDWYTLDKQSAQIIHIMMMRSQVPLALTIGPFGAMSTQTALKILKVAYSYVSIMKG